MKRNILLISTVILLMTVVSFSALATTDSNNGDWSDKTVSLRNTEEADLMVRVGDIDNVGFGFEEGYNPFTAEETSSHGFPWEVDPSDPQGTDRIMLGSSYDGVNGIDGYSDEYYVNPDETKVRPIIMNYDVSGIDVKNAVLQLYIDDFQAPDWGSKFTVSLNGKDAPFIAEIINAMSQTGPIAYIISAEIPKSFLNEIESGSLEILIDDKTTGIGDGFAIDFAKLLVNYKESSFKGTITGTVFDDETGEPVKGATVRILGTSTTIKTGANGNYTAEVISGMNAVRVSKDGYVQDIGYNPVPSNKVAQYEDVYLIKGEGTPDIDYYSFAETKGWSNASAWATEQLQKAYDEGLIPDSLIGADMTKPITREEFAELAVVLYEKTTGKTSSPVSPNPFSDTTNIEILKANNLGIIFGMGKGKFEPKALTNREQVATMLSRTIRIMFPEGDYSIENAPSFSDEKFISSWALEHVKYMSKLGIIVGSKGKFMPRALTSAEKAALYGMTTREQAIAISYRTFERFE